MEGVFDVCWDTKAAEALNEIFEFLKENHSERLARKVKKELVTTASNLKTFPERYPKEPLLESYDENFRFVVRWNYKIIFEVFQNQVIITYLFHTRQNPEKLIEAFQKPD